MAGDNPIVVKRIKRGGDHPHHGGAWKVAYADFVTAMMAFFLLMWLINTTTPEQKRGIADYFAPQSISQTFNGSNGMLAGKVFGQSGAKAGGAIALEDRTVTTTVSEQSQTTSSAQRRGGSTRARGDAAASQVHSDDHLEHSAPSAKDEQFESAAESIRQALQQEPDIAELSHQVIVDQTPEGLRIQLVDEDGRPMFADGSAEPLPYTKKLLQVIAGTIDRLPNRISISGHTAGPDSGSAASNWELSAARAEAARAVIAAAGVDGDRIYEISGKAGSEPLLPEDPGASANRRLSIVLLREAPPLPPDRKF